MKVPQPFPYQGSKRNLASAILGYFPEGVGTLIEPFAGSAAITLAAATANLAENFVINDFNGPLAELWRAIVNSPEKLGRRYQSLWRAQHSNRRRFYDEMRDEFNRTGKPDLLLYLLARCVKAAVRYNASGEFNQSPDNRRRGMLPECSPPRCAKIFSPPRQYFEAEQNARRATIRKWSRMQQHPI